MTVEILKEFMRRLNLKGYRFELDDNGVGYIYAGRNEKVFIDKDGDIDFFTENEKLGLNVISILKDVNEYMTAFIDAEKKEQRRDPDTNEMYDIRLLLSYNKHILTAIRMPDGSMEFDVSSNSGGIVVSHSHEEYAGAKHEFALRTGLIDRDLLFTMTQLKTIRSTLSDFLTIDNGEHFSAETEKIIKSVIEQINTIIPESNEQEPEAEEEDEWE